MVREDIVAGLKIAVERGESLEIAKQSFILAGYPRQEVEEAANLIHSGSVLLIDRGENFSPLKIQPSLAQPEQTQLAQQIKAREKPVANKVRRNFKIILLVIILLVLIGILITTIVFRDKIVTLFS